MKRWLILVLVIIVTILVWSTSIIKEHFDIPIRQSTQKQSVIRTNGRHRLDSNTTYYFDLKNDTSYLLEGKPRDSITLEFPESPKDGDIVILIDKNDRFGWGNQSYDFKFVLGEHIIRGDLESDNLFPYRGGYVIFIWNEKENSWDSNGYKGDIQNKWSGWYRLVYKGFIASSVEGAVQTSIYPSYMRIDATQSPILVTYYGGTDIYPINLVLNADIGELNEDETQLIFPTYPSRMNSVINMSVPMLRRLKNGIIIDFDKGGGWKKDERLRLNENPIDLHDLN
jgi:hypothetical protein